MDRQASLWAAQVKALKPALNPVRVDVKRAVRLIADAGAHLGWRAEDAETLTSLTTGDAQSWDFGEHMVGYLRLRVALAGGRQDSPVKLRFVFAETPGELASDFAAYRGALSASWLQEETVFLDSLPAQLELRRRYAFRYVRVEVTAVSPRFRISLADVYADRVTSATGAPQAPVGLTAQEQALYRVSLHTLRDCMQAVFEDGPKRDRRLWLGDLRLQALTNAVSYRNFALVKRCLMMFAAARLPDGRLPCAVYDTDPPLDDEVYLVDYALLFVTTLAEYLAASGDEATARELCGVATEQLRIVRDDLDANGCVTYPEGFSCFIDWTDGLDKRAAAQGVYLYALESGIALREALSLPTDELRAWRQEAIAAARTTYWNADERRFVSGGQISWASQIWLTLGGALDADEAARLLTDCLQNPPTVGVSTPYLTHYLIEALDRAGLRDAARRELTAYWGGMLALGADTFWELYAPDMGNASPYGDPMIHSYCHAWSCTPAWFLAQWSGIAGETVKDDVFR